MSGHSKWHRIKHKKEQTDNKRGKLFTQLTRDIRQATRSGVDPAQNAALREAIERARKFNLPQSNIDRILSEDASETTDVTYEGYGADGVALLITATTDNTNRTVAELRALLKSHGGRLADPGSVLWKFKPVSLVEAEVPSQVDPDELELALIDAGADDINYDGSNIIITGDPTARGQLETALEQAQATISNSTIAQQVAADQRVVLTDKQLHKLKQLITALSDHADVTAIHTDVA